ncbi:MAG: hypothetical protein QM741_15125 [Rudaea sp.]
MGNAVAIRIHGRGELGMRMGKGLGDCAARLVRHGRLRRHQRAFDSQIDVLRFRRRQFDAYERMPGIGEEKRLAHLQAGRGEAASQIAWQGMASGRSELDVLVIRRIPKRQPGEARTDPPAFAEAVHERPGEARAAVAGGREAIAVPRPAVKKYVEASVSRGLRRAVHIEDIEILVFVRDGRRRCRPRGDVRKKCRRERKEESQRGGETRIESRCQGGHAKQEEGSGGTGSHVFSPVRFPRLRMVGSPT